MSISNKNKWILWDKISDMVKFLVGSDNLRFGRRKYSFSKIMIIVWMSCIVPIYLTDNMIEASFVSLTSLIFILVCSGMYGGNMIEHATLMYKGKHGTKMSSFYEDKDHHTVDVPVASGVPAAPAVSADEEVPVDLR